MIALFSALRVLGFVALLCGGLFVAHRVQAGDAPPAASPERHTAIEQTRAKELDIERARASGLSVEEWQRYTTLMRGPRGLWTPSLDPIWVLGIHARTDDERRRYAEMAAQQEHARVEGELAFQRAYDSAFRLLYANEPVIDTERFEAGRAAARARASTKKPSTLKTSLKKPVLSARDAEEGMLLFVPLTPCPACDVLAARVIERVQRTPGTGVDIYFVGAQSNKDNAAIQAWAQAHGVPRELVASGRITLNYDQATSAQLRKGAALPLAMKRNGERIDDLTQAGPGQ